MDKKIKHHYTDKEKSYIKYLLEDETNYTWKQIVERINKKFNTERTEKAIRRHVEKFPDYYSTKKQHIKEKEIIKRINSKNITNVTTNQEFDILNKPNEFNSNEIEDLFKNLVKKSKEIYNRNKYNIDLKFSLNRPICLAFMSDVHLGNSGTDYESIEKHINLIDNTKNMYCYVGGDLIDNFIIEKILEAVDASEIKISTQWKLAEYFLKKFDGNILAMGNGNHTNWTMKKALFDNLGILAQKLNIIYTAHGAFLNIKIGSNNQEYKIHIRHNYRFNSSINRHNAHKRLYEYGPEQCDIVVLEHHHEPDCESFFRHGKKRFGISTGSYKISDNYALDCGFFHASIGVPCVILFPEKRRIIVFEEIEDAALHMKYLNMEYDTK